MEAGEESREAEAAADRGHEHGLVTSKTNVPLFTLGRAAIARKEKEKAKADKTTEKQRPRIRVLSNLQVPGNTQVHNSQHESNHPYSALLSK